MKTLASALLAATLLVSGCSPDGLGPGVAGVRGPQPPVAKPLPASASSAKGGWGQLDQATILVPGTVFGYAKGYVADVTKAYEAMGGAARYQLVVTAWVHTSPDGFKTTYAGDRPISLRQGDPLLEGQGDLAFALAKAPAGEHQYYVVITANVLDKTSFAHVKTFQPHHVSDYGKNFRAIARR